MSRRIAYNILSLFPKGILPLALSLVQLFAFGQTTPPGSFRLIDMNPRIFHYNDTLWVRSGICKTLKIELYNAKADSAKIVEPSMPARIPLFTVHGNVTYDFLYRSFTDTPFAQHDFQQHTIQTSLSVVVKDKYPMRINLSTHISNSPYFRNFFDINTQFDQYRYLKDQKLKTLDNLAARYLQRPDLKSAEDALKKALENYNDLRARLNEPDIMQKIIGERERKYHQAMSLKEPKPSMALPSPTLKDISKKFTYKQERSADNEDSTGEEDNYRQLIDRERNRLDSMKQTVARLQQKTDSLRNSIQKGLAGARQQLYRATNSKEIRRIAQEQGIEMKKEKGFDAFLADVKSFGIGRSMINYSELTAWNVALTGINIEYNPGIYTALAAGKIDYGFRDFMGRNTRQRDQNLLMGRIGLGDRDHAAVILSVFTGHKYNFGSALSDTISNHVNTAGYSVEMILKKDEFTSIGAEVAKTTRPVSGNFKSNNELGSLVDFSDRSNLGISIKGQTIIRETRTRLSGFYKKTGQNFQSFSLFTYNTDQTAWLARAEQPFFKDKVSLIAMLRRNDFTNPFAEKTFKSSTVFKSLQATVRFPKWPMLSVGYYPGTQLYIIDKQRARENAYYILNGSLVHMYSAGGTRMISSLIYNRYSSKGTDSGFIAYKGISYMGVQSILLRKLQLQGSYTYTDQEQMRFYSVEGSADIALLKILRLGAAEKYNRILQGSAYWGSRAFVGLEVKKLGTLQLQYEKSYLPTIYRSLFPVETGRVTWFKYF